MTSRDATNAGDTSDAVSFWQRLADGFEESADTLKALAGALLFIVGVLGLAFLTISLLKDASLWIFGTRTQARVVDLWAELASEPDAPELSFRYFMQYTFTTAGGHVVTETSSVGSGEWAGLGSVGRGQTGVDFFDNVELSAAAPVYQEQSHVPQEAIGGLEKGGSIDVVYFSLYPSHNRIDDSRFVPALACAYVPFIVVFAFCAMVGWRLARPIFAGAQVKAGAWERRP
jgi:hypothetical protein